ncbi:MAG: hypothetical protein ACP5OB_06085 [Candidatus Ratteibacteria bacterium]
MEKAFMFLSFFLGFLSVVMAFVLSYNTNKLVRTEDERTKSLVGEIAKMIQKMDDTLRRMDDTLRFLGTLIKAEGEEAKKLINKVLEKIPG